MANGDFVDTLDELGVTEQEFNDVVAALNEDDSKWQAWWIDQKMPQGLQVVEIHMHPTVREWVEQLWAEREYVPANEQERKTALIVCELILDSMIT